MYFNREPIMKGPSLLNTVNITINVPDWPGVFLLIKSDGYDAVYVERSYNLRAALISHLPENEKSEKKEDRKMKKKKKRKTMLSIMRTD